MINVSIEDNYIAPDSRLAKTTLVEFVQALARRQARLDSWPTDEPETLH